MKKKMHHVDRLMLNRDLSIQTINAVITLMGSNQAAAKAMKVNVSTLYRWTRGHVLLSGTALVAARAIIMHPDDYQSAKEGRKHG